MGLVSSFLDLGDWLAWSPGNGKSILVGEDPIMGGPIDYKLSTEDIYVLRMKGYKSLCHVLVSNKSLLSPPKCIFAAQLGLKGYMAEEWTNYTLGLYRINIHLTNSDDSIKWS